MDKLKTKYCRKEYTILPLERNLGFSKANNIGYSFIRSNYKDIDFLFVCNSDVEFFQTDFMDEIIATYDDKKFDILGPDIFAPSCIDKPYRGHQSPAYPWEAAALYVKYSILLQSQYLNNKKCKLSTKICCKFFSLIENIFIRTIYKNWRLRCRIGTPIQGSCIILSRNFINRENALFYPETKFYYEELLLYLRVRREGYVSVYNPKLRVIHRQGRASQKKSEIEKDTMWQNVYLIESGRMYLKALKEFKEMIFETEKLH